MPEQNLSPESFTTNSNHEKYKTKEDVRMEIKNLVSPPENSEDGMFHFNLVNGKEIYYSPGAVDWKIPSPSMTAILVDVSGMTDEVVSDLRKSIDVFSHNRDPKVVQKKTDITINFLNESIHDNEKKIDDEGDDLEDSLKLQIKVKKKELLLLTNYENKAYDNIKDGKAPDVSQVIQSDLIKVVSNYFEVQKKYSSKNGKTPPANISNSFDLQVGIRRQLMFDYLEANMVSSSNK